MEIQMHKSGLQHTVLSISNLAQLYEKHKPGDLFRLGPAGACKVFDDLQGRGVAWSHEKQASYLNHPSVHGITHSPNVLKKRKNMTSKSSIQPSASEARGSVDALACAEETSSGNDTLKSVTDGSCDTIPSESSLS